MLSINFSELVWTIINFFLLFFVLKRFLFNPISRFMDSRQARIDEGHEAEREAAQAAAENEVRLLEERQEQREEARQLINNAAQAAQERRDQAVLQAQNKAGDAARLAGEALEEQRRRETEQLAAREDELAALLAQRLLEKEG